MCPKTYATRQDFEFDLPPELIAHSPPAARGESRLLVVGESVDGLIDKQFTDLWEYLKPADLLVRNNTKVLPARLFGRRPTGGQVEILLERITNHFEAIVQIGQSKPVRVGQEILLRSSHGERSLNSQGVDADDNERPVHITVIGVGEGFFSVRFSEPAQSVFERFGEIPLPPYIARAAEPQDRERYQTVYAQAEGAVAAPTAGLHFTAEHFAALQARGIEVAEVTLHVGAGTFKPVKVDELDKHEMHAEWFEVNESVVAAVHATRARGGRVVAVGTTSVRSLESAALSGQLVAMRGESRLFIRPGFQFKVVDAMITNFHLSGSTLMMLVGAFSGVERIKAAYQHAIRQRYRFFSYGDAMFLSRGESGFIV